MKEADFVALMRQFVREEIAESKKPFIDPKQVENEERLRAQARRQSEQERANIKAAQNQCTHIAGSFCLSEFPDFRGRTSIVWHLIFGKPPAIGVCTVCQREFHPSDPDYKEWLVKPSFNKPSAGGREAVPPSFEEAEDIDANPDKYFANFQKGAEYDDNSDNPELWTDEKIDQKLEIHKQIYRLQKELA